MKETTGLPILGELFEQYVPLDSELTAESKEFRLLFFLVMAFFEYTREDRDKSKCLRWYRKSGADEEHRAECEFFNRDGIYRKVKGNKNFLKCQQALSFSMP